ncbi:MAG TPA: hypothetical protein PKV71_00500 [Calditrichia bacterium]|nr:hypothetical protein [Calditrichota bacterium]HQV30319.1 hypothetical protein [Calditrichia bacterium]
MRYFLNILILSLLLSGTIFAQAGLQIHGYLTQAFAVSDKSQIFGIPTQGTSDYRSLALQFNYQSKNNENLVIQLSHRRVGRSPLQPYTRDIELDWAFFEKMLLDNLSFKFGRIQLPYGLFNELRDVGLVLPFFSVAQNFYPAGSYAGEALDGISVTYTHLFPGGWETNLDLFGGRWEWMEAIPLPNLFDGGIQTYVSTAEFRPAGGIRLEILPPITGMRMSLGNFTGNIYDTPSISSIYMKSDGLFSASHISLELDREKYLLVSEYLLAFFEDFSQRENLAYLMAGYRWNDQISTFLQGGFIHAKNIAIPPALRSQYGNTTDIFAHQSVGAALNWRLNLYMLMKVEAHRVRSFLMEDKFVDYYSRNTGPETTYFIISLATGF